MKHLRRDYDGIRDDRQRYYFDSQQKIDALMRPNDVGRYSTILADEPVFVLRAKDPLAVKTVRAYALLAEALGCAPEFATTVQAWAEHMRTYASEMWPDGDRCVVDVPPGALRQPPFVDEDQD